MTPARINQILAMKDYLNLNKPIHLSRKYYRHDLFFKQISHIQYDHIFLLQIKKGNVNFINLIKFMQTQKQFQAQKFATFHYAKLLKAKHAVNSSPNRENSVKYSSRNLTHMSKYQQKLQQNKLVGKLIQIYVKPSKKKIKQKKQHKSLVNVFVQKQKTQKMMSHNISLCDRIFNIKSTYSDQFSKKRQKKLRSYSKLLKKNDTVSQIRNQYFTLFQNFMTTSQRKNQKKQTSKNKEIQHHKKRVFSARPFRPSPQDSNKFNID